MKKVKLYIPEITKFEISMIPPKGGLLYLE